MKILMTTLFDPDRRDGISSHEASIVTSLTRKLPLDEVVVLTKADKENANLAARLAQFGTARSAIFYNQKMMTIACIRLLLLKLRGASDLQFPSQSSYILIGYHWVFWLPFLRSKKTMVFVPFDCWSAREMRVSNGDSSLIRKYGRRVFSRVVFAFEYLSAGSVDLFGFVSKEEIDKYVKGLNPKLKERVLSRVAILPMAEYSEAETDREILSADVSRVLIWMDGRTGYGVSSIIAAVHAIDTWALSEKHANIAVTLLSRKSDAEMQNTLGPKFTLNNIEFIEGDLAVFLSSFDIIILPDLNGSGLKNRTIHSIASGACVIATPVAAEGLTVELKNAIHVMQNLDRLGDKLDGIFSDRDGAQKMALAARSRLSLESQETGERAKFFDKVILSISPN